MKKIWLGVLLFSLPLIVSHADDEMEGLIQNAQGQQDVWKDSEGDLPPARLLGAHKAVLIFSPANETTHDNYLCSSVEFDTLLNLDREQDAPQATVLNTKIPRIRESLADDCLIRPGDPLLAVGPGWQELVTVKDFIVRK